MEAGQEPEQRGRVEMGARKESGGVARRRGKKGDTWGETWAGGEESGSRRDATGPSGAQGEVRSGDTGSQG